MPTPDGIPVNDANQALPNGSTSSRGQSGGSAGSQWNDFPDRLTGLPPKHNPDARGGPSMSADVNASEIMQNMVMNDDDKEWYAKLFKKQAKNFLKPRFTVQHGFDVGLSASHVRPGPVLREHDSYNVMRCLGCAVNLCRLHVQAEAKKRSEKEKDPDDLLLEPDSADKKGRPRKKEVNAIGVAANGTGASIRGYNPPLSGNQRKMRKRAAQLNARSFGGAKP